MPVGPFLLAFGSVYALALGCRPLLGLPAARRRLPLAVAVGLILLGPLIVPAAAPLARRVLAIQCVLLVLKLVDLHRAGHQPDWREYAVFLVHPFAVVYHSLLRERPRPRRESVRLLALGAALVLLGRLLRPLRLRSVAMGFYAEHFVSIPIHLLGLLGYVWMAVAVWRLFGGRALNPLHNFFIARSPADFWRRFNRLFSQWVFVHLVRFHGPPSLPVRLLLGFAFSAVVHEYLFGITLGRVQGYQTLFFLIHGFATVATWRVRRRNAATIIPTAAFNLVTAMLALASWNQVLGVYRNEPPPWLSEGILP